MELSKYLKIIQKNLIFIIVFSVFGAVLGFYTSLKIPAGFRASQTFFLSANPQNIQTDNYDGYYRQSKAIDFTDTAVSLINTLTLQDSQIEATKMAPLLINITTISKQKISSEQALSKVAQAFNQKLQSMDKQNDLQLTSTGNSPQAQFSAPSKLVLTTLGFILGIAFSVTAISLKTLFQI